MNTQKLIAITAGAVFLLGAASSANAANETVTGSFSATVTHENGNAPTLSTSTQSTYPNLSNAGTNSSTYTGSLYQYGANSGVSLTVNGGSATYQLLSIDPNGSSGCGGGSGCNHDISDASISVTFSNLMIGGQAVTPTSSTDTGTFYADYNSTGAGSYTLSQAGDCSTSSSGDDTDCVVWSSGNNPLDFTLDTATEDYTLAIDLVDAQDWDITPDVTFTLTGTPVTPPTVPEPASMVLFASGLVGLTAIRRRMSRKSAAAA